MAAASRRLTPGMIAIAQAAVRLIACLQVAMLSLAIVISGTVTSGTRAAGEAPTVQPIASSYGYDRDPALPTGTRGKSITVASPTSPENLAMPALADALSRSPGATGFAAEGGSQVLLDTSAVKAGSAARWPDEARRMCRDLFDG